MNPRLLRPLLFLVALVAGCSPTIDVEVLQPARVNLGAGRRLTVVQTEGLHSARGFIVDEFMRQTRERGFFQVSDRTHEGILVKVTGSQVVVYGGTGPAQEADEIGVRLDVIDWDALRESRIVRETAPDGTIIEREEVRYVADAIIAVTAFNVRGQALLAEYEYHTGATAPDPNQALEAAGAEAIHRLMDDITPTVKREYIRFDDEDPAQEATIEIARRGNLFVAIEDARAYVEAHPDNASAHYNLAVLLDAAGQYRDALPSYTRAIELHRKDFYVDAKADCAARLTAWEQLTRP
ncbi:tetratricopeptide repeat protein [Myxococcaceae bacterium GXIMD 01537]